jgi:mRNA interferase YafQ
MLKLVPSSRFKRDFKQAEKRGKDTAKLRAALQLLVEEEPLPERYRDHPLQGRWKGYRDLHLEPDWLLLYRVNDDELQLARTGSHADLFGE